MVVEKKPSDATKQGDKTAKTSKDSTTDPTKPEENTPKDGKKPIVEEEDLVNYFMTREIVFRSILILILNKF